MSERYIVATRVGRRSEKFEVIDTQPENSDQELPGVSLVVAATNRAGYARRFAQLLNRHGLGREAKAATAVEE